MSPPVSEIVTIILGALCIEPPETLMETKDHKDGSCHTLDIPRMDLEIA